jgi:hypothetical protein
VLLPLSLAISLFKNNLGYILEPYNSHAKLPAELLHRPAKILPVKMIIACRFIKSGHKN